jgi:hypothetical protein
MGKIDFGRGTVQAKDGFSIFYETHCIIGGRAPVRGGPRWKFSSRRGGRIFRQGCGNHGCRRLYLRAGGYRDKQGVGGGNEVFRETGRFGNGAGFDADVPISAAIR